LFLSIYTPSTPIYTLYLHDALPILLTGCWDRQEINDVAFVLGKAIDREKDGYRVSVVIPLPGNMGGPSGGSGSGGKKPYTVQSRSEEHTSELQSREKLVCRLLLEKK